MVPKTKQGLKFRMGGNPPTSAGMFLDGVRIAWWPASRPVPNQAVASRVLMAYEEKGAVLTRDDIEALTDEES